MPTILINGQPVNVDASFLSLESSAEVAPGVSVGMVNELVEQAGGFGLELGVQPISVNQPMRAAVEPVVSAIPPMPAFSPQAGDDLRDFMGLNGSALAGTDGLGGGEVALAQVSGPLVAGGAVVSLVALLARLPALLRGPVMGFFRNLSRGTVVQWSRLPGWLQTILGGLGISVGTAIVVDIAGGPPTLLPQIPGFGGGAPDAIGGVQVIGSWEANGVRFYRLSDGRLAVQNKRGRWKVWRPKRPIVIMPTGANNLRTLLRADAVLNKQAKKIAAMLNRRGQRRRSPKSVGPTVIVAQDDVKMLRRGD